MRVRTTVSVGSSFGAIDIENLIASGVAQVYPSPPRLGARLFLLGVVALEKMLIRA